MKASTYEPLLLRYKCLTPSNTAEFPTRVLHRSFKFAKKKRQPDHIEISGSHKIQTEKHSSREFYQEVKFLIFLELGFC